MTDIIINDNITLHYIPMEKMKTTAMGMYIHRDLNREDASKNAILPHVLKRGCSICRSSEEIAHYLENLYGAKFSAGIAKRGSDHILCFDFETISDRYAPGGELLTADAARLMMAMVFAPLKEFDTEAFNQERENSIMKIKNIINDKRVYANYRCQEELAKGDNFEIPRLGYAEDLEKLTPQELYDYYRELAVSSVIDIYVCGSTDISETERIVRGAVDGYSFKKAEMPRSGIIVKNTPVNNVVERLNVTQGKLSMGFLTGIKPTDDDSAAMTVANAIYGGGAQSKLFNNVREKLSLAYYAGSMTDKYKGILMVNAGIEFKNFEKAYSEVLIQLEEMKKGNITEFELESSKKFLISSLNACYDDQNAMISYYLNRKIAGTSGGIEEHKDRIQAVTMEDVVNVISKVKLDTVYFLAGKEDE